MPRVYEFDTEIKEIDENRIRLKENFFYPEGGGQPADHGTISHGDMKGQIFDVQDQDDTVWIYSKEHGFEEGELVHAEIDKYRRETLTRNHSAQHLLSAVFWDSFEYETSRALIELHETEIELDHNPSLEDINEALTQSQELIQAEIPVTSQFHTSASLNDVKLRGGIVKGQSVYRLVQIGTIDLNPCGGTHVEHTGMIDTIAVEKISGKRLKFTTGIDARNLMIDRLMLTHQLSRDLAIAEEDILSEINRLSISNKQLQKDTMDLENQYLQLQLNHLDRTDLDEVTLISGTVRKLERGVIVDHFSDLSPSEIAVITTTDGGFVIISGDESQLDRLMPYLRDEGIKGGGRGTTVMGKNTNPDKELIQLVKSYFQRS